MYMTIELPFWPLDPPHAQMLYLCRHLHLLNSRFYKRKHNHPFTFPLGPLSSCSTVLGAPTMKHILKPARAACASNLEGILRKIASNLSEPSWHLLLSFAQNILRAPKREGRKRNLASAIIKRTNSSSVDDEQLLVAIHEMPNLLIFSPLCRSVLVCLGVAKQPCTPRVVCLTA